MPLSALREDAPFWVKNEQSEANPWLMMHEKQSSCYGKVSDILRGSTKPLTFSTPEAARRHLVEHPDARREKNAIYKGTVTGHDSVTFERVGEL